MPSRDVQGLQQLKNDHPLFWCPYFHSDPAIDTIFTKKKKQRRTSSHKDAFSDASVASTASQVGASKGDELCKGVGLADFGVHKAHEKKIMSTNITNKHIESFNVPKIIQQYEIEVRHIRLFSNPTGIVLETEDFS